jgi:hypothetical protein
VPSYSAEEARNDAYPNHTAHAEYLVNHTEVANNIEKIPVHQGFGLLMAPLRLVGGHRVAGADVRPLGVPGMCSLTEMSQGGLLVTLSSSARSLPGAE